MPTKQTVKLSVDERDILTRMARGWVPMVPQLDAKNAKRLEKHGLIRPWYDPVIKNSVIVYNMTDAGRAAIGAAPAPESEPAAAAQPATPAMTAERGLELLQRDAANAKARYEEAKEAFVVAATRNPSQAIDGCGRAIRAQAEYETWFTAMAIAKDGATAVEQLELLRAYVEDQIKRFIRSDPWRPNSTSPAANLVRTVSASGRGEVLGNIRETVAWILSEIEKEAKP